MGQSTFGTKLIPAQVAALVEAAYKTGMNTATVPAAELIAAGFADG